MLFEKCNKWSKKFTREIQEQIYLENKSKADQEKLFNSKNKQWKKNSQRPMLHCQAYQHIFNETLRMRKKWEWEIAGEKNNNESMGKNFPSLLNRQST